MKPINLSFLLSVLLLVSKQTYAQHSDTWFVKDRHINTKVLKEGSHRYLVNFKIGKNAP